MYLAVPCSLLLTEITIWQQKKKKKKDYSVDMYKSWFFKKCISITGWWH